MVGRPIVFGVVVTGGSGSVLSPLWSFGDGSTAGGPSAVHSYGVPGVYRVDVNIRDDRGNELQETIVVSVGLFPLIWPGFATLVILSVGVVTAMALRRRLAKQSHTESGLA